ncbi:TIM barrel protein [Methylocella sp. CPCC 101449]|jgi:hydroxypyruvate isomerase|uniref:hydroxypyruvate isomerase family protein n=1 Tax=Methylocella sp. CPCC 101449 TaxID=2987531 RepID=UPI00288D37EE|nr:TIM barrel protein [Methylocella sp. CPCC 101449]MDT2020880.1 TIM barrel protein [Methylocella sp. CPCC 101449]HEV2570866.1 TIM barrel protein [Beijerinckiaceae bacterium]
MPAALRFSANISLMFTELPFLDRIEAAARAGFAAVECHYPYEFDPREVKQRLDAAGIVMNGINTIAGKPGEFGLAAQAGRQDEFAAAIDQALSFGAKVGAGTIHCMSGTVLPPARDAARQTFLENMAKASDAARSAGITLLIEPINRYDRPDYFVSRSDDVAVMLAELRRDNVKLMFDFYHIQISEGDLIRRMEAYWPIIGHFQFASVPKRQEPDEGEIAYGAIFATIAEHGWPGFVAAEYKPRATTAEGLGWMQTLAPA